jgi:dihydroneopterin aldolase
MADWIRLHQLQYQATHGALPHEKTVPQPFWVDVEMRVDTVRAGTADLLGETVNYAEVVLKINEVMALPPVNLLETLAERIAQAVLMFPGVSQAGVRVKKMAPPIEAVGGHVEVEIWRDA